MKKIIISLSIIAAVAVVGIGATIALFSDTETSAGNIFTAGSIDLKVDHTAQTYNGVDCKTCNVNVVSDTSNVVTAGSAGEGDPVNFPHPAQLVTFIHPAWTADVDGAVNDAKWVWATDPVVASDLTNNVAYTFEKTFTWMGPISGATLNMGVAADNGYEVYLNSLLVGADPSETNYNLAGQDSYSGVVISTKIVQGMNTLKFIVRNKALTGSGSTMNPAGLLYKLTINGNCGDEYFQNHCGLWQSTDLTNQTFFNFDDIKPGDYGTNVISLHVDSNDAYACLLTSNESDLDNTLAESEDDLGDTLAVGELSPFLKVFAWDDADNDGVYEGETQLLAPNTPIVDLELLSLSLTGGGPTLYVGLAWCAGTQSVSGTTISCDGSTMGDIAQTDSFAADLTAYAVQQRNNENFTCDSVVLPQ